jgi:hypothetical protein
VGTELHPVTGSLSGVHNDNYAWRRRRKLRRALADAGVDGASALTSSPNLDLHGERKARERGPFLPDHSSRLS